MSENYRDASDILGCRFQVSPLSGDFVPIILGAMEGVNTEKIWNVTERTSTVYRGRRVHVVDCVKTFFSNIVLSSPFTLPPILIPQPSLVPLL